jgi:hypothetical protein
MRNKPSGSMLLNNLPTTLTFPIILCVRCAHAGRVGRWLHMQKGGCPHLVPPALALVIGPQHMATCQLIQQVWKYTRGDSQEH